ncbi:MAG: hypothetical protein ACREOB_08705 [Thermodesulfobacteriota bacterium]
MRNVDDLLESILSPTIADRTQRLAKIKEPKIKVRQVLPRKHQATMHVKFLMELWRLANET